MAKASSDKVYRRSITIKKRLQPPPPAQLSLLHAQMDRGDLRRRRLYEQQFERHRGTGIYRGAPAPPILPIPQSEQFRTFIRKQGGRSLRSLVFATNNHMVTDDFFNGIFCPNLRHLDIRRCSRLTDRGLAFIAKSCPKLKFLNISGPRNTSYYIDGTTIGPMQVTDKGLASIANGCPNLRNLNVSGCRVTDNGLGYIAKGCRQLHSLNVAYCVEVTNNGLEFVGKGCPELRKLNVENCNQLKDDGLASIATGCHELLSLNVSWCSKHVTNKGLGYIASGCRNLQSLAIEACSRVTDNGLESVAHGCSQLQNLNVGRCSEVTDKGIVSVAKHCKQLQSLNVYGCWQVTYRGLNFVLSNTDLKKLDCDPEQREGLRPLFTNRPARTGVMPTATRRRMIMSNSITSSNTTTNTTTNLSSSRNSAFKRFK